MAGMSASAWGGGHERGAEAMSLDRYARQLLLPGLGEAGQAALADARVLIAGCGGLGTLAAAYLAGAGVGRLLLADDDRVELSNLHRQLLYTEADLGQPKAVALAAALGARNAEVDVAAHAARLDSAALPALLADCDLVLDCCDNFPTRYALNAACVAARRNLLSAAAIRREGLLLALQPGQPGQACYHCVFPDCEDSAGERCAEAGVLGPSVGVVASLQATQALEMLTGRGGGNRLWRWQAGPGTLTPAGLAADPDCTVCGSAR